MPSLRPRKATNNYAQLAGLDSEVEQELGPILVDDEDSGSEFAPPSPPAVGKGKDNEQVDSDSGDSGDESDDDGDEGEPEDDDDDDDVVPVKRTRKAPNGTPRVLAKPKPTKVRTALNLSRPGPGGLGSLSTPGGRQKYALPTPSVHHRYRAAPLFARPGLTEQLLSPPRLFSQPETGLTNNFTKDNRVTERVTKSWGYYNGRGPVWELVEDRGWWKESGPNPDGLETEAKRRPRVYSNITVLNGWSTMDWESGKEYLPSAPTTTEDGSLIPPGPVSCSFGPMTEQQKQEMEMFEVLHLNQFLPESNSVVFNAGAPVWGMDWCPIAVPHREARKYTQYLAVAPFPSPAHSPAIGGRLPRPVKGSIQIWAFGASPSTNTTRPTELRCEMILCHDSGPAHTIKWCPLPSDDDLSVPAQAGRRPRKLGLLSGTFDDGTFSIYVVPEPRDVQPAGWDHSKPVLVHLPNPVLRIELEETACWSFDWANSETIAIGTANGVIAVFNLGPVLKGIRRESSLSEPITDILPTHYISVHQSAIRALAWVRVPPAEVREGEAGSKDEIVFDFAADPTLIGSGGYDGLECLTDIREERGSTMNRTRDIIPAMSYSPYAAGPVTIDHENVVKVFSASPSMLGRGHTLLEPLGPVWAITTSDYHPTLAVGGADGICCTTNMMRSTRRGGSVPFFMHKIYQMDYSRDTKEYRMLENFLPVEARERPTHARTPQKPRKPASPALQAISSAMSASSAVSTGAWPSQIGIHCATWNQGNGLPHCGLLATGTASGLCRIDNLWGRWMKGKIPYTDVKTMRLDGVDGMDESEGEDSGDEV